MDWKLAKEKCESYGDSCAGCAFSHDNQCDWLKLLGTMPYDFEIAELEALERQLMELPNRKRRGRRKVGV